MWVRLVDLLFLSSDISDSNQVSSLSQETSFFSISQYFFLKTTSFSSSYSESSLCRITYIIFMEQSFSYSIFLLLFSKLLPLLSYLSRINVFPQPNLSFLKSQSKLLNISLLFSQKQSQFLGSSRCAIYQDSPVMLSLQIPYSSMSISVFSMSLRASFCIYFQRISIFFLNYLINFSLRMTSTASSTYLVACLNGALSNLSTRKVMSSIVSIFMA